MDSIKKLATIIFCSIWITSIIFFKTKENKIKSLYSVKKITNSFSFSNSISEIDTNKIIKSDTNKQSTSYSYPDGYKIGSKIQEPIYFSTSKSMMVLPSYYSQPLNKDYVVPNSFEILPNSVKIYRLNDTITKIKNKYTNLSSTKYVVLKNPMPKSVIRILDSFEVELKKIKPSN